MSPRMSAILLREAAVEPKGRPRCTLSKYSYTHIDLYRHWPNLAISPEKELHVTNVIHCTEDNEVCNDLRSRLAALTPEERYELFNMAQRVDDMLDGTITH